jgi:hypothetical protein
MPPRYRQLSKDLHLMGPGPKRILALDGGGHKGILTLGYLEAHEQRATAAAPRQRS